MVLKYCIGLSVTQLWIHFVLHSFMHLTDCKVYFIERFLTCYYKSSETKWLGMISKKGLGGGVGGNCFH